MVIYIIRIGYCFIFIATYCPILSYGASDEKYIAAVRVIVGLLSQLYSFPIFPLSCARLTEAYYYLLNLFLFSSEFRVA